MVGLICFFILVLSLFESWFTQVPKRYYLGAEHLF